MRLNPLALAIQSKVGNCFPEYFDKFTEIGFMKNISSPSKHNRKKRRQSLELLNDFRSGFRVILEPKNGNSEIADALVDWVQKTWGGRDFYCSRTLRGQAAAWMQGLVAELTRLCPDTSAQFIEQFQTQILAMYGGNEIYIPNTDHKKLQKTRVAMFDEWKDGKSINDIASAYGYTCQWTRKILNNEVNARRASR